jgi:hypothetical protein
VVFNTGDSQQVLADEEVCRVAYQEWVDSMSSYGDETQLLQIAGFTDSADKAPLEVVARMNAIKSISIMKMY